MKKCSKCQQVKDVSDFYKRAKKDGTKVPSCYCKECTDANYRKWRDTNKDRRKQYDYEYHRQPENQVRRAANRKKRAAASPRGVLQITLAHGLKRRCTANPATIDDLMEAFERQNGKCALSGLVMTWNQGHVLPTSLSIDRIDQTRGYSKDNVRLICHAFNAFRGRMNDAEMFAMAVTLVEAMIERGHRIVNEAKSNRLRIVG